MSDETTETPPPVVPIEPAENADLIAAHLDAAGARGGLDPGYTDVAAGLLKAWCAEKHLTPSKDAIEKFVADLRVTRPKLFTAPPAANTAPVVPGAPAAPAAGGVQPASAQWQALRASGRMAEAEVFYRRHRAQIIRGA